MSRIDGRFMKKFFEQETPSGTVNGSNVTFTLAQTPQENAAVLLFLDDTLKRQTADYSISGVTITMVTAPANGQTLYAFYIRKSGE